MAVVVCPSCGRYNLAEELEARGFACELCRQTIPIPDGLPKDVSPRPMPLLRERQTMPMQIQPSVGNYPVSKVCPNCGHTEYKQRRPERFIAFTWDRVCKACETRYTPPTPTWAAIVFLVVGFPLAGLGFLSIVLRLLSGNVLAIPAMACEGFLGFLGVLAIVQGLRALIKPGKA